MSLVDHYWEYVVINHRKEKRFPQKHKAVIRPGPGSNPDHLSKDIEAETYDISIGGARIVTHKFFPIGTIVRIQIELKDSEQSLKIDGEIKWGKKVEDEDYYEFGLEFMHEISRTIMSLLGHLYGERQMIPSTVRSAEC